MSASDTLSRERRSALRGARPPGRPLVGPYWFILPAVVMLSTVYLGPMIYAMTASGTYWVLTEPGSEYLPAGLANYADVLSSPTFWHAVRVTLLYALTSVVLSLTFGTTLALLLDNELFFASVFRSILMIPMVITPAVIAIFWKLLYEQEAGVFNSVLTGLGLGKVAWLSLDRAFMSMVLMDVWQSTPFFMLVILAGLQSVDQNLLEARGSSLRR